MIPIGTRRILIVGGGLSGLVTAYRLHQAGLPVCLIEARSRLGGRILSAGEDNRPSNDGLDLGPSWFWPDMTPEILPLIDELGLTFIPQHTDGLMLFQRSQGGMPERYPSFRHQPSSMRLAGGTGAMVSALAARLPQDCLHLESRVIRRHNVMLDGSMMPYRWTINGRGWGDHAPIPARTGERVEITFHNMSMMAHPMHLHGHVFQVVGVGTRRIAGALRDTVHVPPMNRVTIAFDAGEAAPWMLHCHHMGHLETGMMTELQVQA